MGSINPLGPGCATADRLLTFSLAARGNGGPEPSGRHFDRTMLRGRLRFSQSGVRFATQARPVVNSMAQRYPRLWPALIAVFTIGCSETRQTGDQGPVRVDTRGSNTGPTQQAPVSPAAPGRGLRPADPPSDAELLGFSVFAQPLAPAGPTSVDENRALGAALAAYDAAVAQSGGRDAVAALEAFLAAQPNSAWKPPLLVNLGMIYRQTGRFSKALDSWQRAWELTRRAQDDRARAVADAAGGLLAQLQAELGHKETLEPLLAEIEQRALRGPAAERVREAVSTLAAMQSTPELAFKTGPFALSRMLQYNRAELPFDKVAIVQAAHASPKGFSLSVLHALSERAGMGYQMAFRAPAAVIITPAVAHWRVGHYAAIVATDAGRYRVQETTFGEDIRMSVAAIDDEASGYFLIPNGPVPVGWRAVGKSEADGVWGR